MARYTLSRYSVLHLTPLPISTVTYLHYHLTRSLDTKCAPNSQRTLEATIVMGYIVMVYIVLAVSGASRQLTQWRFADMGRYTVP